jgi:hypothetical protein
MVCLIYQFKIIKIIITGENCYSFSISDPNFWNNVNRNPDPQEVSVQHPIDLLSDEDTEEFHSIISKKKKKKRRKGNGLRIFYFSSFFNSLQNV